MSCNGSVAISPSSILRALGFAVTALVITMPNAGAQTPAERDVPARRIPVPGTVARRYKS